MKRAITIKDIAEQLQLSRNTVSKALNGQYVPEKTRKLVMEKAKELNYKSLNELSEAKGHKQLRILLVSGKPLSNFSFFIPIVGGIENYCYQNNYEFFQYTHSVTHSPFHSLSSYIKQLQPDGIVAIECFEASFIEKLLNQHIPTVFYDFSTQSIKTDVNYDIVTTDNQRRVYDLIKVIQRDTGFTEFCFVGDPTHCLSFYARYAGVALATLNISRQANVQSHITRSDDNFDYGSATAIKAEIIKLRKQPQCYVCCNDFVARNVCRALHLLDVKIPEQAMVIGHDNIAESQTIAPTITSFAINKESFVMAIMNVLLLRIKHPDTPSRTILLDTQLIERESTRR